MSERRYSITRPGRRVELGLALGGGGMKGWAHVGLIEVLEEYGLRPDRIAGCSAGAIMGAAYAYGMPVEEMLRIMREQDTSNFFTLHLNGQSLLNWEGFRQSLVALYGDTRLEDLPIPFSVVCTDLETGQEVVLEEGPLVDAILASSAVPGIFPPVKVGDRLLVDGGLVNNVPVSVLARQGATYIIASKLHRQYDEEGVLKRKGTSSGRLQRMERVLSRFWRETREFPTAFAVMSRSLDILMAQLEHIRLQMYTPDVVICPQLEDISSFGFAENKEEIYLRGRAAALEASDALLRLAERLEEENEEAT